MISRIVIIGKLKISTYTIYRALSLGKPVIFLSITGKPVGAFYPWAM
jgi:CRISPR/Cas system-associated endonuclease Cas1